MHIEHSARSLKDTVGGAIHAPELGCMPFRTPLEIQRRLLGLREEIRGQSRLDVDPRGCSDSWTNAMEYLAISRRRREAFLRLAEKRCVQ
jgi:hypothetical protein